MTSVCDTSPNTASGAPGVAAAVVSSTRWRGGARGSAGGGAAAGAAAGGAAPGVGWRSSARRTSSSSGMACA
jgi:hypothetical protein